MGKAAGHLARPASAVLHREPSAVSCDQNVAGQPSAGGLTGTGPTCTKLTRLPCAGIPGFGAALGVQGVVVYTDHIARVLLALALYALGLALSSGDLCHAAAPVAYVRPPDGAQAGSASCAGHSVKTVQAVGARR